MSFQVSFVPVSVALNEPPALTGSPRGFGTSCLLSSFALNCIGLAECPARATAARIPVSADECAQEQCHSRTHS